LQLVGSLLRSINTVNIWQVCVYQLDFKIDSIISVTLLFKPQTFVILLGPVMDAMQLPDILVSQMLRLLTGIYFNPKARFIIVVAGHSSKIN
jgi:hypothetical protein